MAKRVLKHSFSLLHIDYVKLNSKWNYSNIISPYYRLYYIDEGEGLISGEKDRILLEPGYLYLIPSFTLCSLNCQFYLSQYFIQFFEESVAGISLFANNRTVMKVQAMSQDVESLKRILEINPGRGINRSNDPKVYEKNIYYREYQELNNLQSMSAYMETQGIILQLISRFLTDQTFKPSNITSIPSKVLEAVSYIHLNLKENLSVMHLAERANQHPDYFSRIFQQATGERPINFIHEKRIERAQYLLTTTNMPYDEIAAKTGFETTPYFSRIFKKVTGMTPGQYRQQNRSVFKF
ncbi:helix-turn-helix domain-containing protein [Paradesertivirga mongoliensis]|uniref:Helix-turn-helix domain-containing protein n=1 Tax=Paradesertivirga mongoliensis TaxID=2100740 RepID=A0ABW4ZKY2_9SPHI|nr:AraC family transcriptional regulator [Pedobacter mongoliensis]